jgi:hypothetical protein
MMSLAMNQAINSLFRLGVVFWMVAIKMMWSGGLAAMNF